MRSRLRSVIVCVGLALLFHLAVAWSCFYFARSSTVRALKKDDLAGLPAILLDESRYPDPAGALARIGLGWSSYNLVHRSPEIDQTVVSAMSDVGLPFRSLRRHGATFAQSEWRQGQDTPLKDRIAEAPYRPIWLPFALNTLVFFVPLFVIVHVVPAWRRRRRVARRLCSACAYPRADRPVCTECGHRFDAASDGGLASAEGDPPSDTDSTV